MQNKVLAAAAMITAVSMTVGAHATILDVDISGPGVSGAIALTYGPATDSRYTNAFVVTDISGTFSDTNVGIDAASIGTLLPRNFATPDLTNHLAPDSFSRFAVATGLPPESGGFATYDNLVWPAGSPPTATDYPFGGGFLDIYGLLFTIGDGRVVNFWSNGDTGGGLDYGVSVSTASASLDYVSGGVAVPEPASFALLAVALTLACARRRC